MLPLILLLFAQFTVPMHTGALASSSGGSSISFIAVVNSPAPASGVSTAIAPAINVHAIDKIIVYFATGGTVNVLSCTDTIGNTFTATTQQLSSEFGNSVILYAVSSASNASDVVTCTSNTGAPYAGIVVLQYRGGATSSILDGQTGNYASGVGSYLTPSFTTTAANEVIVQCAVTTNGGASAGLIGGVTANLRANLGTNWYACQDRITTSTQTSITANLPFTFSDYQGNAGWFK